MTPAVIRLEQVAADTYLLCGVDGIGEVDSGLERRLVDGNAESIVGAVIAMESPPENHLISHYILDGVPGASGLLAASVGEWFIAVTFTEEGPRRGETRRAWMLFQAQRAAEGQTVRLGRGLAVNTAERARRIPELAGLANARAVVVGAGSIGSAVCLELAKGGVGALHIIDLDFYDPNNTVRHILPVRDSGKWKAVAVADACIEINPFIDAQAHNCFVGIGEHSTCGPLLPQLVEAADVVVDATASQIATHVLQRYTRALDTPLVVAALTAGSHGGEIVVVRPRSGCFDCFVLHQRDGSIPNPPRGRRSNVVPIGCVHPAFSGAGFDATELAAASVRTAVQASGHAGYPPLEHDWAVLDFRAPARSETGSLTVHPDCTRHR
jgi:molybdopterin/thiamine biosynthesis adenylyltransferase